MSMQVPKIIWSPIEGAETYRIQISTKEGFDGSLVVNEGNLIQPEYIFTNSEGGVLYRWRVRGESSSGNGDWSDTFSFTTDPSSSFKLNDYSDIILSPNPVSDQLKLEFRKNDLEIIQISIFDMNGNSIAIYDDNFNENGTIIINTSYLSSGIYLIVISDGNEVYTKQFTKIN